MTALNSKIIKTKTQHLATIIICFFLQSCSSLIFTKTTKIQKKPHAIHWDFSTLDGWVNGSQNMKGIINYHIDNGNFNIHTRANTWDRPKIKTADKIYTTGKYTWRIFVPELGIGDMASIGAFIYNNDQHELDFEIGYGSSKIRKTLNTSQDEVIVYMTSQALPFKSIPKKIKSKQWYDFEIELIESNKNYEAIWYINNIEMNRLQLDYGDQYPFYIFCSMENLKFIGDHIPNQDNFAWFDYVKFEALK